MKRCAEKRPAKRGRTAKAAKPKLAQLQILPRRPLRGTAQRAIRASQAPNASPRAANVCHRSNSRRARRILTNAGPSLPGWEGKFPIRVTRKKGLRKPHPFSALRAAAPRNQRCDETRRPTQRSRPPHRRKKQNTRIWKFFLAVPSRDGPTRRAHHCAATRSDSPKSGGQRSAAARCKISKVCNQRFANPSLPSPTGTAQRVARASQAPNDSPHVAHVDGPPASRTKEKARFYPHEAQNRAFAY